MKIDFEKLKLYIFDHRFELHQRLGNIYWKSFSNRYLSVDEIIRKIFEQYSRIYPLFGYFAMATFNYIDKSYNAILSKDIAKFVLVKSIEKAEFAIVKDSNGKKKLKKVDEVDESDEILQLLRTVEEDEELIFVIGRHPVKNINGIVSTIGCVKETKSQMVYLSNEVIEKLEGDFDGDFVYVLLLDLEFLDGIQLDKFEESKKSIDIPEFEEFVPINPKFVRFLNIDDYRDFIETIAKAFDIPVDRAMINEAIRRFELSTLLKFIIDYPIIKKIETSKDSSGLKYLKYIKLKVDYPDKKLDYSLEVDKSRQLEALIRAYFKSYGPKFAGYVQKVLLDISDVAYDKGLISEETFKQLRYLELIDRLQQAVIDLKHSYNPLDTIDKALKVESLVRRVYTFDHILEIVKEFVHDDKLAVEISNMILLAQNKSNLSWSYGLTRNVLKPTVRKVIDSFEYVKRIIREVMK